MSSYRVRYQTIEVGEFDLHLRTLRDKQQFADPEGVAEACGISSALWPIFGVVWPSSIVLANVLIEQDTHGKRILEVGCGIGLASLILNKQHADISATDHHPEVERFLQKNTELNQDKPIKFERLDWNDTESSLGVFDLIVGSDLLYEDEHIKLLAKFINKHAAPTCEVLLVDPDRGRKSKFTTQMTDYGYQYTHSRAIVDDNVPASYKGHVLRFSRH